jgi:hypothetical protein
MPASIVTSKFIQSVLLVKRIRKTLYPPNLVGDYGVAVFVNEMDKEG